MFLMVLSSILVTSAVSHAEIRTQTVEYRDGDTVLEGYLAFDPKSAKKRPGVVIVHEWMGLGDNVKRSADELAKMGYIAFAADIYGKGVRPNNPKDAAATADIYKKDRALMRRRAQAALDELLKQPQVDAKNLAAIGYCFGGTTALELARSGAPLKAIVSFHGGLNTPTPQDAKNIKGQVLVLHGADDPFVPKPEVEAFQKEMKDAKVKMKFVAYPNTVHSFTNPDAGTDNSKGAAYNADSATKAWGEMKTFFKKTL